MRTFFQSFPTKKDSFNPNKQVYKKAEIYNCFYIIITFIPVSRANMYLYFLDHVQQQKPVLHNNPVRFQSQNWVT